ncbi:demethylmenaquinone methyltransferase [Listeria grandensis]|uniref:Demethylmenaquinone methyltransferase n=1 Tax=Listeria grandensis TaxID=1494963 RepID=A0A7X0Y2L0_9LIST|nr:demethylmenaquinone methyltransferase [Listeria grandensis]MBC1473423.1 demethylmenaquinone methyltransferase [Listeria grandensis]MBC1935449.1 demethylmenaquinone methyltransferase [Listeria grandensis]MBC6314930.1 demethylmenaquinone methyltransferase [Listeria grandensis]
MDRIETKEEKVHSVFEKISPSYDRMNSLISFHLHEKWRAKTMEFMRVKQGTKALDVCCGTADWTLMMADAVGETGSVIGLDFSENMLAVGQEKVLESPFSNITLMHGNAMVLPFADSSFDYVTIGFGLRNVPDYMTVLREMHRVLKPGGLLTCLDTSTPTIPGYNQLFFFYFRHMMPLMGKLFAKSYEEYAWLEESTRAFPGMKKLADMFQEAGFDHVRYVPHSGGASATHFGYKKKEQ